MTTTEASARIAALEPPYESAVAEQLAKWMPPGDARDPLILFRTLAVNPELMSRMLPLGAGILGRDARMSLHEREIVIDRICARAGAEYEWGVHVTVFAHAAGLTDEQVAATALGTGSDAPWSADEAMLVALCDELHDTCTVSDELWERLATRYDSAELLELVIAVGWYRLLCGVINAARIELEPWAARFPVAAVRDDA